MELRGEREKPIFFRAIEMDAQHLINDIEF